MKGFVADIEDLTEDNSDYRRVLYTGTHLQLVLMSLAPGEEIGEEVHKTGDQFFRVEKGKGEVWIDGERTKIKADDAFIIPAGARHNVINTGGKRMKLYTLYSPPPSITMGLWRRPNLTPTHPKNTSTATRPNSMLWRDRNGIETFA